jgi:hypothetical protein
MALWSVCFLALVSLSFASQAALTSDKQVALSSSDLSSHVSSHETAITPSNERDSSKMIKMIRFIIFLRETIRELSLSSSLSWGKRGYLLFFEKPFDSN